MNVQTKSLQPALKHGICSVRTLLPGEDEGTYDDFLGRVYAAIKPIDIIDEMLINDVASLQLEISRWRRLKSSLMQIHGLKALEKFLREHLDYYDYRQYFERDLTNILQQDLACRARGDAQTLARQYALNNDPHAEHKVNQIITRMNRTVKDVEDCARATQSRKSRESILTAQTAAHRVGR